MGIAQCLGVSCLFFKTPLAVLLLSAHLGVTSCRPLHRGRAAQAGHEAGPEETWPKAEAEVSWWAKDVGPG